MHQLRGGALEECASFVVLSNVNSSPQCLCRLRRQIFEVIGRIVARGTGSVSLWRSHPSDGCHGRLYRTPRGQYAGGVRSMSAARSTSAPWISPFGPVRRAIAISIAAIAAAVREPAA